MSDGTERPRLWLEWATDMFGEVARDPRERALRFLEESVELAQSLGIDDAATSAVIRRVYARPPGDLVREFGQVQACFEMLALVSGVDVDAEVSAEFDRVRSIPRDEWERRYAAKCALGIAG